MQSLHQQTQILTTTCQTQQCGSQQGQILKFNSNQNEQRQAILKQVTSVASCTADIEHYV